MKRCLNCMEEYEDHLRICPWCGGSGGEAAPFVLKAGSILQGRYIVGTCRRVRDCDIRYIGWDALFERKVYIDEFYPPRLAGRSEDGQVQPAAGKEEIYEENRKRFFRERRELIRLYKADDIEEVYSCFSENGTSYAVFRFTEGMTLRDLVEQKGRMDESEAMACLYMALEALKKIHGLGLVHGAVELENLLVTEEKKIILCGFGEPCHWCGNPRQRDYGQPGEKTDLYGLAAVLGKLLLGKLDARPAEVARWLDSPECHLPVRTVLAVKNSLTKDEKKRITSLKNFYDRVFGDSVTMKLAADGRSGGHRRMSEKGGRRLPFFLGTAAGVMAVLVLAVFLAAGPLKSSQPSEEGETVSSEQQENGSSGPEESRSGEESGAVPETEETETSEGEEDSEENSEEEEKKTDGDPAKEQEEAGAKEPAKMKETSEAKESEKARETSEAKKETSAKKTTQKTHETSAAAEQTPAPQSQPAGNQAGEKAPAATSAPETAQADQPKGSGAEKDGIVQEEMKKEEASAAETLPPLNSGSGADQKEEKINGPEGEPKDGQAEAETLPEQLLDQNGPGTKLSD